MVLCKIKKKHQVPRLNTLDLRMQWLDLTLLFLYFIQTGILTDKAPSWNGPRDGLCIFTWSLINSRMQEHKR